MRTLINTLAFLLIPLLAIPQFSISGKVTVSGTGEPLPGTHLQAEGTFLATATQKDGTFHLKNLKAGKYRLKVTFIGFRPLLLDIKLHSDTVFDILMEPTAIMGEEVIISGTRAGENTPVTYSTLDADALGRNNHGQDMPYLLRFLPSMVESSDAGTGIGYTSLRIRGTDLTRINVTMNGVPLNDAESHGVWWVDLPDIASSLEDVQVQRGVGTSTNGPAAFGATIGLSTKPPSPEPFAKASLGAGSFNTWRTTAGAGTGLIDGRWAFEGRYSQVRSDGYIDRASAELRSYYASGGYYGKKHIVKMTVFSGEEQTYQAWDGVPGYLVDSLPTYNGLGAYTDTAGNLAYYDDQTDNYLQTHYQLYWAHQAGQGWTVSTALHYTRGKGYYEEYREDQDFGDYRLSPVIIGLDTITETDLVRRRWLDNHFTGLSFSVRNRQLGMLDLAIGGSVSHYTGDHYGEVIWSELATNIDKGYRWYEGEGRKTDGNLYVKAGIHLSESVLLYADAQLRGIDYRIDGIDNDLRDIGQEHQWLFFNPKAGLSWVPGTQNKVYLSFGIAHREPNRSTLIDANPAKPMPAREILYDAEAGFSRQTGNLAAGINAFYMYYRDQLVLTGKINDVGDPVMENVPVSYRAGIEAAIGWQIARPLNWNLNATISLNKIKDFTEYIDDWDNWPEQIVNPLGTTDIAFSPGFTAGSVFTYTPWEFLDLELYSKYVGSQYTDNTSSDDRKLDPYFIHDFIIRFSKQFSNLKAFSLSLKVNNLFNTGYISNGWVYRYYTEGNYGKFDGFFPQAGRHLMAGLDFTF